MTRPDVALTMVDRAPRYGINYLELTEGAWNYIDFLSASSARRELCLRIVERAHAHGIRVYGATITPFGESSYFSAEAEAERQSVNAWIRNSGKFDAVIDFDAAIRDAQNPSHLVPAADSGDHMHPGDAGYKIMSDTIDLKLFAK